jgi:acylphosphatase
MSTTEPPAGEPKAARLVRFDGRVQGVGFRYTTAGIARGHPVAGYVKNLPDGRVEVYAEGTPAAVEAFLVAVRARWRRNIDREEVEEPSPTSQYSRFEIAH